MSLVDFDRLRAAREASLSNLSSAQAQVDQSVAVQALIAEVAAFMNSPQRVMWRQKLPVFEQEIYSALAREGIVIPDGYQLAWNGELAGRIVKDTDWHWDVVAIGAAAVGGMFLYPAILGGATGAGTGGAVATGAGTAGSSAAAATTGVVSTVGTALATGSSVALGVYQTIQRQKALEAQQEAQLEALRNAQQGGGLFGGVDQTTLLIAAAIAVVIIATR